MGIEWSEHPEFLYREAVVLRPEVQALMHGGLHQAFVAVEREEHSDQALHVSLEIDGVLAAVLVSAISSSPPYLTSLVAAVLAYGVVAAVERPTRGPCGNGPSDHDPVRFEVSRCANWVEYAPCKSKDHPMVRTSDPAFAYFAIHRPGSVASRSRIPVEQRR